MTLLIWLATSSLVWGAVLWTSGRLLQRSPSVSGHVRQWIWRGATLLLIAPWVAAPVVLMFGLGLAPPDTVAAATVAAAPPTELVVMHAFDATPIETAVVVESGGTLWAVLGAMTIVELALLAVIAGWLVRFVMAQVALRKLLGIVMLSRAAEAGGASDAIRKWASRLKLRRTPRLRVVAEQHSPFSYGVLRPTVCLPEGLEAKLSRQSLDLVVGHECLHVARGDGWLRPLERVTADVFWFNPFAWLIRRELDVARELAVDEAVIALADARIAYARTLRDVAGISAGLPIAAPAASMSLAGGRSLVLRVNRTLAQAKSKPGRAAIVAACVLGLFAAPVAIGQVMMVVPAPPAPEAPEAPDPPEAPAALEAPEAPEALVAPEPPAAEVSTQDGKVRATFSGQITKTSGDAAKGFNIELLQLSPGTTGETCLADMQGLGSLAVSRGQTVASGDVIGGVSRNGSMRFAVVCSDEVDGSGRPTAARAPVPPTPPAGPAEAHVNSQNGEVRASFAGEVMVMSGDAKRGYAVRVSQLAPDSSGEVCVADIEGLGSLNVASGQMIARGALIGKTGGDTQSFALSCSDKLDGAGWPVHPTRTERVAPVAPVAPVSAPSPVSAVAPVAPAAPATWPGPAPAPLAAPSPVTPAAPAVAPTPPTPPAWDGRQMPPAPPMPLTPTSLRGETHPVVGAPGVKTSPYGERRDPFSDRRAFHAGVDIAAYKGAPIHAPAKGSIIRAENVVGYGNVVELGLAEGYVLRMGQLDEIKVAVGDTVNMGDVVGTMGSSGPSTGPHLHLEVLLDGKPVDPQLVKGLVLSAPAAK